MNSKALTRYAPVVLRLGLSAVFAWFGTSQLTNQGMWTGIVPAWATSMSGMDAATIVKFNGTFELIAATLLALGVYVRIVAAVLCIHLLTIASTFGFSATGVRDYGLSIAALASALFGDDVLSLVTLEKKKEETSA